MQGSSSSRNNSRFEREVIIRPRCNVEGIRKVLQSTTNPGRVYFKCANSDKFLGWADEVKQNMEGKILTDIAEVKKEVTELKMIVKMIEKGQSVVIMLLIAVIVVLTVMLV
uniref:Uncharacterized protein n=1 Tax=Opuntia streptacantha TaxID=393608 RepID=A0A7C9A184_OPUST